MCSLLLCRFFGFWCSHIPPFLPFQTYSYFSAKLVNGQSVLMELGSSGNDHVAVAIRCENAEVFPLVQASVTTLLA